MNGEDTTQNEYVSPAANVEAGAAAAVASTNSESGNTQATQSSTTSTDNPASTRTSGDNAGSNNLYTDMDFD